MHPHHRESSARVAERIAADPEVRALILGGSVAHGFAAPGSDIDVMLVVADEEYEQRLREGRLQYFDSEVCTYEGGYVDGKYLGESFLARVEASGSEPARFAFADAEVLFSRLYPYHKWFLRVLEASPDRPADLLERIAALHQSPTAENAFAFYQCVAQFRPWECDRVWPVQFMLDSELNWLDGRTPVDDL